MTRAYHHVDEATVRAPARRCYELVAAIRRYGEWWPPLSCTPLGPEGTLRPQSRFRLQEGKNSWVVEVTATTPWRQIDWQYAEGDLVGPVRWEFVADTEGENTRVRHAYRGVRPNSDYTRDSFASGSALVRHAQVMQEILGGMRRILESRTDVSGGDLFESIHTLRSVRSFRPDPVPDAVLRQVLEAATRAASARNAQPWLFVAVRDPDRKRRVAALYEGAWQQAQSWTQTTDADADIKHRPGYDRMMRSVDDLAHRLDHAPVLVLACVDTAQLGPMADGEGNLVSPQSVYASIFPAVQNLLLAARGLGLGSTLTTVYAAAAGEIRRALGIPPNVHVAALVPLGYPFRPFAPTTRKPIDAVAFLDAWGTPLP